MCSVVVVFFFFSSNMTIQKLQIPKEMGPGTSFFKNFTFKLSYFKMVFFSDVELYEF